MPNCYRLVRKDGAAQQPGNQLFIDIDEAMCAHFGVQPHAENWFRNWENKFGLAMAMGMTYDQIRDKIPPDREDDFDVLNWLESHYNIECWFEHR